MGFSMFSKPLGRGALGSYNWGGTAVGAGAGAALAGRDHRTAGAVVGGLAGNAVGLGVSVLHGRAAGMTPEVEAGYNTVKAAGSELMGMGMNMLKRFRRV
jgi:hypothetical protein